MDKEKLIKILTLIFLLPFLGIGLLLVFIKIIGPIWNLPLLINGQKVEAIIIDKTIRPNDDLYDYKIEYLVDGKTYKEKLDYITNNLDINGKLHIYCDKNNPQKFASQYTTDIDFAGLIFPIIYITIPIIIIIKTKRIIPSFISNIPIGSSYMSNQNYSQSSSSNSKFNPIFIIIIGLIIFGIGVISTFNDMRYKSYSKKVVGEVEKISDETGRMYIYVKYEVNGKILVNTIDYYNDNIYVGEKITVYYDINNTNKIKYDTTRFGIIFIFLGIVFIGTSIWIYYKKSKI